MSDHPAFVLANGNLTYDPAKPYLCTDEPHICYGVKTPVPPRRRGRGMSMGGGGGWLPIKVIRCKEDPYGKVVAETAAFAKKVAANLVEDLRGPAKPHPEGVPGTKKDTRKKTDSDVEDLRRRIKRYKKEIDKLRKLRSTRNKKLQEEVECLRATVAKLQVMLEALERVLADKELAAQVRAEPTESMQAIVERLVKNTMGGAEPQPIEVMKVERPSPVPLLVASVAVALASALIPEEHKALRYTGFGVSAGLAVAAFVR